MAKTTKQNPRGAGRKQTNVDGRYHSLFLPNATFDALAPLIKETGSLGGAIVAVVDRYKLSAAITLNEFGELLVARRKIDEIKKIIDD